MTNLTIEPGLIVKGLKFTDCTSIESANGHTAMTADMAIKVGLLTGTTPESWLVNQAKWVLWQATQKPLPKVEPLDLESAA